MEAKVTPTYSFDEACHLIDLAESPEYLALLVDVLQEDKRKYTLTQLRFLKDFVDVRHNRLISLYWK